MQQTTPPPEVDGGKTSMRTVKLDKIIIARFIVVSVLFTLLMACSYKAPIVENSADEMHREIDECKSIIRGNDGDISRHVHVDEVFYNDGSFWS